jgi:replicative superfamily II helicase
LYTDSQAGIDLKTNVFQVHPKSRHFNRDINYVRQCVQMGQVELVFVPTENNPADLLTKLLGPVKHAKFTKMLLAGVGLVAVAALFYNGVVL